MKMNPGIYSGDITEMVATQNTNGTPYMAVVFAVTNVAQNGAWVSIAPETRTVRLFLTDKAIDFSMDKLKTIGFNGDFSNPKCSINQSVMLICEHRAGTGANAGKVYENWDLYTERAEQERIPVSSDIVRQMNARWRSKYGAPAPARVAPPAPPIRPAPARQAVPAPVAPSAEPTPEEDYDSTAPPQDNIPF